MPDTQHTHADAQAQGWRYAIDLDRGVLRLASTTVAQEDAFDVIRMLLMLLPKTRWLELLRLLTGGTR